MVKKKGIVWNYFTKRIRGSQVIAFCKFCNQSYIQNATRMEKHIERCEKCPENIRKDFVKLVRNKRANSLISWSMQQNQNNQNNTHNENEENVNDWEYEELNKQILENNSDDIDIDDSKNWIENSQLQPVESEEPKENQEWDVARDERSASVNESIAAQIPALQRPLNRRVHSKRVSHMPLLSNHNSVNSFLNSKIQREQYLERLALRKIAELELQRKTLEFEKLKWEHTVEKTRNEMRWAHECRMMQLKEEYQQNLIKQTQDK
ncbi:putative mediator of RNA polymerase II transcription subunit 26 [Phymastichus coffea]|uniref:putative mediator of RNA polymerase II transcription subunit 26 n=1 Tax=Phymastichus coffea TaxID=108790 RepID=UPI00273BC5B3|nr:putative mediator of RNA polymerase II transcription subunit 26 [Phymastichus coffea]XP_058799170.1 putative mediator of RNA polymerase II transcription subunit 26 [Phymastichus coffea]XP_058799171.1 putative mediator of RNA polymerase II transcription subunit 26 [Phymastichus coffea]XP_058799172.1 putative mediator of RNA polymerase II transcription subunit 26 [Phymastichus coffea]XP_058799173.1 putative mediator of RNA polymerase II transcription subunit 26 [Phymastichus coffea]XP_0587991